nr:hypothetical protein [Paenibacillus alvei]
MVDVEDELDVRAVYLIDHFYRFIRALKEMFLMVDEPVERFHLQDDSSFFEQRCTALECFHHYGTLLLAGHALQLVARLRDDGGDILNFAGFNRITYPGDIIVSERFID